MTEEEKKEESRKEKIREMLEMSEAEYGYLPEEEEKKTIIEEVMKYLQEAAKKKSREIKGVA